VTFKVNYKINDSTVCHLTSPKFPPPPQIEIECKYSLIQRRRRKGAQANFSLMLLMVVHLAVYLLLYKGKI